jgi:hypothetical protein
LGLASASEPTLWGYENVFEFHLEYYEGRGATLTRVTEADTP